MIESNVINLYPDFAFPDHQGLRRRHDRAAHTCCPVWMRKHRIGALQDIFGPDGLHARFVACRSTAVTIPLRSIRQSQADRRPGSGNLLDRPRPPVCPSDAEKAIEISAEPISVSMSPWSPPYQWKTAPKIAKNDAAVYGAMGMPVPESSAEKPRRQPETGVLRKLGKNTL